MARLLGLSKVPVFAEEGDAKITGEFGESIKDYPMEGQTGRHTALDLVRCTDGRTSEPATITAMADGVIIAQRKWVKGFRAESATAGNCVHIRHNNGMVSKYFHLEYGSMPDWIKDGAPVKKNDVLGYMGATGYAFGVHLHFQVEDENGVCVDPEPYLLGIKSFDPEPPPPPVCYRLALRRIFDSYEEANKASNGLNDIGISTEIMDIR
ncbi:MAG: M23 family metallopeptidase [Clostridia bacterium]|nr:M23 family metallopeptidase [Clostridia bacterium]